MISEKMNTATQLLFLIVLVSLKWSYTNIYVCSYDSFHFSGLFNSRSTILPTVFTNKKATSTQRNPVFANHNPTSTQRNPVSANQNQRPVPTEPYLEITKEMMCEDPSQRRYRLDGKCYRVNRRIPCQENNMKFYPINDKQGICDCQVDLALLYWPQTDSCYKQNTQGPCPDEHWITLDNTKAVCQPIPEDCQNDGLHFYWRLSEDQPLQCHRVNERGPCPPGYRFRRFHYFNYCSNNNHYVLEGLLQNISYCPLGSRRAKEKLCIPYTIGT